MNEALLGPDILGGEESLKWVDSFFFQVDGLLLAGILGKQMCVCFFFWGGVQGQAGQVATVSMDNSISNGYTKHP